MAVVKSAVVDVVSTELLLSVADVVVAVVDSTDEAEVVVDSWSVVLVGALSVEVGVVASVVDGVAKGMRDDVMPAKSALRLLVRVWMKSLRLLRGEIWSAVVSSAVAGVEAGGIEDVKLVTAVTLENCRLTSRGK